MQSGIPRISSKLFYGWVIVAVVAWADFMVNGVNHHVFGYFFKPMSEELGLSRSMVAGVPTARLLVASTLAVPIGFLLDRYGPRAIMAVGALAAGVAAMATGAVQSLWQFYLFYALLGALGQSTVGLNVITPSVAKWFVRRRGRAMAFTVAGMPLAGVVLPPLTFLLISTFGWRLAWAALGVGTLILVVPPTALLLRRQPEDLGLAPDGAPAHPSPNAPAAPDLEESWTVRDALSTTALWLLILGLNLGAISGGALAVHQIPYMSDKGFTGAQITLIIMLIGLCSVAAKFLWGFLAERFPLRHLMAACLVLHAGGILILVAARSLPALVLFALVVGLSRAGGLWIGIAYANYFGRRFLGGLRGIIAPIQAGTSAFSVMFAGVVYDATGSYTLAFQIFAAITLVAAVVLALAKPPRRRDPELAPAAAEALRET